MSTTYRTALIADRPYGCDDWTGVRLREAEEPYHLAIQRDRGRSSVPMGSTQPLDAAIITTEEPRP